VSRPEKDKILEHDYDGIREYDNPLPGWWVLIFHVSIIWAAGYAAWMHFGPGLPAREARFAALDARVAEKAAAAAAPASLGDVEPGIRAVLADPDAMAAGKATFAKLCMPCHLAEGQGLIGPNLTDDYFIHGWTQVIAEVFQIAIGPQQFTELSRIASAVR
jgi:cytochrome c oxidase cbb3-type subunit 3